jgi:ribosomal protein S24E
MKFKTIKESDNRLLSRREFMIAVDEIDKTPKREELLKQISAKMGFDDKKVVVDKIYTSFGMPEIKVFVKVYDSAKDLESIESKKNKKVRGKVLGLEAKETKKEEKKVEEKKEAPKEKPKEEPKKEIKEEKKE